MQVAYPEVYPIADAGNVKIYKNSFPNKFLHGTREQIEIENCGFYPQLLRLASITHSVGNIMPCLQNMNKVKGLLAGDYLPLFVNLIQDALDNERPIVYTCNKTKQIIDLSTLKTWHTFFLNNIDKFCLSMYYETEEGQLRLAGKPFFKNQSLNHKHPLTKNEVEECLNNMISRIEERARHMLLAIL